MVVAVHKWCLFFHLTDYACWMMMRAFINIRHHDLYLIIACSSGCVVEIVSQGHWEVSTHE